MIMTFEVLYFVIFARLTTFNFTVGRLTEHYSYYLNSLPDKINDRKISFGLKGNACDYCRPGRIGQLLWEIL